MFLDGDHSRNVKSSAGDSDADFRMPAEISDIGRDRDINEDRCATIRLDAGTCYLVLDGMGGVAGGEFAAELSIDAVTRCLRSTREDDPERALRLSFEEANRIVTFRRQNEKFREMGTTIVGALIDGSSVTIAHVGDSRAYVLQSGAMRQLTDDHSFVQQLVEQQQILEEEALPHPYSHILTQCLGSSESVKVDTRKMWVWPSERGVQGDILLLCTDGLYSLVSEDEIGRVASSKSPRRACKELVRLANERGGYDNISVSIIPLRGHLSENVTPDWQREVARRDRRRRIELWWQRPLALHLALGLIAGLLSAAVVGGLFFCVYVSRMMLGEGYGG